MTDLIRKSIRLLYLLLFICFGSALRAQAASTGNEVFTIGVMSALPLGSFSSSTGLEGGYAQPGFGASLEYSLKLNEQNDIRTTLLYSVNSFDIDSYSKLFVLYTTGENDITGGSYHSLWILSGITYVPFHLPVTLLVQAGLQKTAYPDYKLYGETVPQSGKKTSKFTPAISLSANYRYRIFEAGVRVMYSRPEFISEYDLPGTPNAERFTRNITLLMLHCGMVF